MPVKYKYLINDLQRWHDSTLTLYYSQKRIREISWIYSEFFQQEYQIKRKFDFSRRMTDVNIENTV